MMSIDRAKLEILIRSLVNGIWDSKLDQFKEMLHKAGIHNQLAIVDTLYLLHKRSWEMRIFYAKWDEGPWNQELRDIDDQIGYLVKVIESLSDGNVDGKSKKSADP